MAEASRLAWLPVAALSLLALVPSASAHEQFTAGKYTIEVGWLYEPPVVDQPNAVTINIHEGAANGTPVTDGVTLTPNLQLGSASTTLSLATSDDTPGFYTGPVVPTEAGDYTVHITGTINGQQVDHTTKLQKVEAPAATAFPSTHGTVKELQDRLQTAEYMNWGLGGGGLLLGLVALIVALSRRRPAAPLGPSPSTPPAGRAPPAPRPPQR